MSGLVLVVAPVPEDLHRVVPRLLELPRPVYLDSSLTDSRGGCYSYFTADPFLVVRSQAVASSLPVRRGGLSWRPTLNLSSAPAAPLLGGSGAEPVGVLGGALGYFGYDTDQLLERVPATAVDEGLPELDIGIYDWVLATDHLSGEG